LTKTSCKKKGGEKNKTKKDIKDPNAIREATKFKSGYKPRNSTRKNLGQAFAGLNKQPHKSQLGSKLIKSEENNLGKAEDMGVIG